MRGLLNQLTVQSLIALMLVGATIYLFIVQQDIPESLLTLIGAIVAFYFNSSDDDDDE